MGELYLRVLEMQQQKGQEATTPGRNEVTMGTDETEDTRVMDPRFIAFAGDWHANTWFAEQAIQYASSKRADVIVHTGDFGYLFLDEYLDALNDMCVTTGIPLLFVDGNHENHDWLNQQPVSDDGFRWLRSHIAHIPRGHTWEWNGVTFLGLGGAHSVDVQRREAGVSWWPEERITREDVEKATASGVVDIMVTHDCPSSVFIPGLTGDLCFPAEEIATSQAHRELLQTVVDQVDPVMLVHGHYHIKYEGTGFLGDTDEFLVYGLGDDSGSMKNNMLVYDLWSL